MKGVKKDTATFSAELYDINPNIIVLGEYTTAKEKILCRCKIDGFEWEATPHNLLRNHGCPKCKNNKTSEIKRQTNDEFLRKFDEKNLDSKTIKIHSKYNKSSEKVLCECLTCRHMWYARPDKLLQGQGCPKCHKSYKRTTEEFIDEMKSVNDNIEILGDFVSVDTPILCRCKKCNSQWSPIAYTILHGSRCPQCTISRGEENCIKVFNILNISYIPQMKFDKLIGINGGKLSYDFYLPDYNMLIECQGQQHEKPIGIFGGESQFQMQQEHDRRKRKYAKDNDILLFEIWYYDYDNISNILTNKLMEVANERMVS